MPVATADAPRQMGVMVAASLQGDGTSAIPARHVYADALVAELAAADDLVVALLYEGSPLVISRQAAFPTVGPPQEWPALAPVLVELAQQLQLDYILVTSLSVPRAGDEGVTASVHGVVVVRGGGSHRILFNESETDAAKLAAGASHRMAQRVINAIRSKLPSPSDASEEEPLPVQPGPPTEEGPATVAPAPTEGTSEVAPPGEQAPDKTTAFGAALAAFDRGDYDAASIALHKAFQEQGPSGDLYLLRARLNLAEHDDEAALKDLHSAVEASPDLVAARIRLARALHMHGLWQDAVRHYRAALAIEPGRAEALLGLAGVYRDHGHTRKAIKLLEEACPGEAGPQDATILVALADLYAAGRDPQQAEPKYLQALALTSGERAASILERLGDLYLKLRRHRDALKCYAEAAGPALAGSTRTAMVTRRYQEVMRAADRTVREELDQTWRTLQDYVRDGLGEREQVFVRMSAYQGHLEEAIRFADSVVPPASLEAEHARRQLAYSLALEATVAGQAHLDLGGDDLLQRAQQRHDDALAELCKLGDRQ